MNLFPFIYLFCGIGIEFSLVYVRQVLLHLSHTPILLVLFCFLRWGLTNFASPDLELLILLACTSCVAGNIGMRYYARLISFFQDVHTDR
jgi:hypothetical protein